MDSLEERVKRGLESLGYKVDGLVIDEAGSSMALARLNYRVDIDGREYVISGAFDFDFERSDCDEHRRPEPFLDEVEQYWAAQYQGGLIPQLSEIKDQIARLVDTARQLMRRVDALEDELDREREAVRRAYGND